MEFVVDDAQIGDTLRLQSPRTVRIRGRATGRTDFTHVELIHNGEVIATVDSQAKEGHFVADLDKEFTLGKPGWLALRTPLNQTTNVFGNPVYSHTSPVYVEYLGHRMFQPAVARELIAEMQQSLKTIDDKSTFANEAERTTVVKVYQRAIATLTKRIEDSNP